MKGQILFFASICQIFLCAVLLKSTGIALHYFPYRDSSVIARFFTENQGLQSFIASGVRSAKTRLSPGLFQPLNLVELVYYHNPSGELHRLSEIRPLRILQSIPMYPAKTAIAMFVAEYLSKILREQMENQALFELVSSWIGRLDSSSGNYESAHLALVWHSFSSIGIAPEDWRTMLSAVQLRPEEPELLDAFFSSEDLFAALRLASHRRQLILDHLLNYASAQLEGMGEIKSLPVLRQVFS